MFRSSMKITMNCFPSSGPKYPFRLLTHTLLSIICCTWFAVVYPENAVARFVYTAL